MSSQALHKIQIVARLRPSLRGELKDNALHITPPPLPTVCVPNPRDPTQMFKFPFTSCYDATSTQTDIFNNDVKPLIDVVFSGITVTIFAYGVTSSGKTHTMQGSKAEPGVIPRVVKALFDHKSHPQLAQYEHIDLSLSYMEIYKDDVFDLLVHRESAPKLPVRENDAGQVFVAGLTAEPIASVAEFDAFYSQAVKNRSTGSTNFNHASSRSHAVLTISVAMRDVVNGKTLAGKINLVDLAGSENNKLTGNDASRMAESAAINKSLSVLGQVVHALNQGASRIPYRNSKLTRILQDALGGSSVGLLICNLAPGLKFRQDTLNTLNFAVRTKNIENRPVVDERDTRPAPKPHFAALVVPSAPLSPRVPQTQRKVRRPSLLPAPTRSRLPRVSAFGLGTTAVFQSFTIPPAAPQPNVIKPQPIPEPVPVLSEKEIDERISKAVEAEVARRLDEERRKQVEAESIDQSPKKEQHSQTLPSGVLTPLLQKHRDLDDELRARLQELEAKLERGNKEVELADVLSPASKKKTGRAYVALARSHSEKGDLQVALDLYRKAEKYVPGNVKLKERIVEIEWAVANDRPFVPTPKRSKKRVSEGMKKFTRRKSGSSRASGSGSATNIDQMAVDDDGWRDEEIIHDQAVGESIKVSKWGLGKRVRRAIFGAEVTNRPSAREGAIEDDIAETPAKRRRTKAGAIDDNDDDYCASPALAKREKTKA